MEENKLQEDINYIRRMIENNRRTLVDNGKLYIGVGVFVAIGSLITYIILSLGYKEYVQTAWLIMTGVFITYNIFIGAKGEKEKRKTFASSVFNALWNACAIPIVLVTIVVMTTNQISLHIYFAFITSILGIGYYLTGVINELKFMKILALGWWLGTVVCLFWSYIGETNTLSLVFAVLFTVLEIIPGLMIYKKWNAIYNEETIRL